MNLPARYITADKSWNDLTLKPSDLQMLKELVAAIKQKQALKQHHFILFCGDAGNAESAAALLGKEAGKVVYRIDLSQLLLKYIGETEKNLEKLLKQAEQKEWVLFFDEADASFGKRTGVKDAHDKYANQEVSYLLQRLENYNGIVIFSVQYKSNIDEAFIRRFRYIISFEKTSSKK